MVVAVKVEDPKFQKLTLKLMHQKSVGEAECIGTAELPIKEVTSFSALSHCIQLHNISGLYLIIPSSDTNF